jgi:hypothetical protein
VVIASRFVLRLLLIVPPGLLLSAPAVCAQDAPPRELLDALLPQLVRKLPATRISFEPASDANIDQRCGMPPFKMTMAREDKSRSYSILASRKESSGPPKDVLVRITRLAVDADGAGRAYHPEDPYGEGICKEVRQSDGAVELDGICALDPFASASIRIFLGPKRLSKTSEPELAREWKDFWPQIRDRRLKSFDLEKLAGRQVPGDYYLFYWKERNLTAVFTRNVIPTSRDGYPCVRGPETRRAGYFVSATTHTRAADERPDGCAPDRYLDAEQIPFFVLPGASFGQVNLGDIVVGYLKTGAKEKVVFGIVGDIGPFDQFGEGSIAFNRSLLEDWSVVMNSKNANALDIDLRDKAERALAILVLGGTRDALYGDYSLGNIMRIGIQELASWGGTDLQRLRACVAAAKVNPH